MTGKLSEQDFDTDAGRLELKYAAELASHFKPPRWKASAETVAALYAAEREAAHHGQAACRANACASGRRPCPTPEVCRLPDTKQQTAVLIVLMWSFAVVVFLAWAVPLVRWVASLF